MAELSFDRNARLITVLRPALEITIQELYDKIKDYEDDLINMDLPQVCTASGKEPLGGGVYVGITLTLLDGWRLTFQDSPDSPVQEVADVTGGNIVAQLEEFGADNPTFQNPIAPAGNLVITKTSSSSATLLEQSAIQFSSFQGAVHIDAITGVTGTTFPTGTHQQPSNNIYDAITIAEERGLSELIIHGAYIIPEDAPDIGNYVISGTTPAQTFVYVSHGVLTNGTEFRNMTLQGHIDYDIIIREAIVDLHHIESGIAFECMFIGTTIIGEIGSPAVNTSPVRAVQLLNCYSGDPSIYGVSVFDLNGSGSVLTVRDFNGSMELQNKSGSESTVLDVNSAEIILDSTVSSGTIILRGVGNLVDNSTGTAVVDTTGFVQAQVGSVAECCAETKSNTEAILVLLDLLRKYDSNRTRIDPVAQTLTVYDDDGVTPVTIFELKDENGNLSITEVYERDPITDRGSPPDGSPLV